MRKLNPRGMTGVVVSALSALDVALWDLAGKRAGRSVAAFAGGHAARGAGRCHLRAFPRSTPRGLCACAAEVAAGAHGVVKGAGRRHRGAAWRQTRSYGARLRAALGL